MAIRWYIVHVYSGFENKIAEFIKEQAEKKGFSHLIEDVMVPTENVVSVRNGSKVELNANREMITELVYNLCDNAIRYNNKKGRVDVYI